MIRQRIVFIITSILVLSFALVFIQTIALAEQANLKEDKSVNFLWAFVILKRTHQGLQYLPITRDTILKSGDQLKMLEFIKNIIHEIRQLRKSHKQFTTEAERPAASTGAIRAHIITDETKFSDLGKFAIEIAANNFFAKTFTIEHK